MKYIVYAAGTITGFYFGLSVLHSLCLGAACSFGWSMGMHLADCAGL